MLSQLVVLLYGSEHLRCVKMLFSWRYDLAAISSREIFRMVVRKLLFVRCFQ